MECVLDSCILQHTKKDEFCTMMLTYFVNTDLIDVYMICHRLSVLTMVAVDLLFKRKQYHFQT